MRRKGRQAVGALGIAYPPRGSRALGRSCLQPQRRQRVAFQAFREEHFMQIFLISVLASASGNRAICSPA